MQIRNPALLGALAETSEKDFGPRPKHTSGLASGIHMGERNDSGRIDWMPPNAGRYPIGHIDTFQTRYSSLARVYRDYDEALLDSRQNSRSMRNDVGIRECLDARQRAVALLNWHLEPEDDKSPDQIEFCQMLDKVIRRISHFSEYRRNCQHAIWYGKAGIQHRWGVQVVGNKSVYMPTGRCQDDWGWKPIHGDKLVFRNQLDTPIEGAYEGQLGVRVSMAYSSGQVVGGRWKIEPTDYGMAYFLSPAERRLMLVHKHHVEDAAFEDGLRAGVIHGVGIRSVIYWEWVQYAETRAFLMNYLERMAGGIQVWKYPMGNPAAHEAVKTAAENFDASHQHVLLVPVPAGDDGQYGVQIIDPGFQGVDVIHNLIDEFFGHRFKRYIMGQTLTSEAGATGMGSGVADAHVDSWLQVIRSDVTMQEESLTSDLVESVIKINVKRKTFADPGFLPRFTLETEEAEVEKKLEAWGSLLDRGLAFKKRDLYELVGAAPPGPDDDVLEVSQQPAGGAGAMPGMPGEPQPGEESGDEGTADEKPPTEPGDKPFDADAPVHHYSRTPFMRPALNGVRFSPRKAN